MNDYNSIKLELDVARRMISKCLTCLILARDKYRHLNSQRSITFMQAQLNKWYQREYDLTQKLNTII